jgi:nucleotide-binding universal stress UspA family protein
MTIVVGVDSSPAAAEALRFAVGEARLRGVPLRVLHVWQLPILPISQDPFLAGPLFEAPPIDPADLRRLAQSQLDEMVAGIDGEGVELEPALVEGAAAETLVEASAQAELLVVGSRGHGGFSGLLLGSVSHACAQHAHCPVVIVRSGAESSPA